MKLLVKVLSIIFFMVSQCLAQGTIKIETDKSNYLYGDSIEVNVSIINNSDTSFSIWGSTTCIVRIGFNSVPFQIACTADYSEFLFLPHSSRTWLWILQPSKLGIPDKDGEQTIYAFGGGLEDSIKITAPKYYGGRISVGVKIGTSFEDTQRLRDSLNATIIYSDTLTAVGTILELWQIVGYSVDSLVSVYTSDYRLKYIEVDRPLQFNDMVVTSVKSNDVFPEKYFLNQNYPNPFNPTTTIDYSVSKYSFVTIKLFDILGKEVATLVKDNKPQGNYRVILNAEKLVSGIYFYRMQAGSFTETKKLILMK